VPKPPHDDSSHVGFYAETPPDPWVDIDDAHVGFYPVHEAKIPLTAVAGWTCDFQG